MRSDFNIDIRLPAHTRCLRMISRIGEKVAQEVECSEALHEILPGQLAVVLTEGVVNAIKHAGNSAPAEDIHVRIDVADHNLMIRIYDSGRGFDLDSVPSPCFTSNGIAEKGRGVFILRSLMDTVKYTRSADGNVLEMQKSLK